MEHQIIVRNTRIESLESISSLCNVGSLEIDHDDRLSDIVLCNVFNVSVDIVLIENEELFDINGLQSLIEVGRNVQNEHNGCLNISGLVNITNMDGFWHIRSKHSIY